MTSNIDQIIFEIRKYNRAVDDLRSEFQAWKDEVRQEIGELKLMIERNASVNCPALQVPIYQPQPLLLNPPIFENACRDIPRFPVSLGGGAHNNTACIDAFLRETMDLLDKPGDSNEILEDKRLLAKKYHSQLNRFTQVTCMNLITELLADDHIDKTNLSWKKIPDTYKNKAHKELEELAFRANIPLNRCINSWGAQILLAKSYSNYRNSKLKNILSNTASRLSETSTHLTEPANDVVPEENLDIKVLPDPDASNVIKEENSDEVDVATPSTVFSPCAVSSPPLSTPPRYPRTRSRGRPASRTNKKRKT